MALQHILDALLEPSGELWRRHGLTRPVVLQLAGRLIMQISTLHRNHRDRCQDAQAAGSAGSVLDVPLAQAAEAFTGVLVATDLKLALIRCALQDLDELARGRADTKALGPRPLVNLQIVMAHHKFASRLLYLQQACQDGAADAGFSERRRDLDDAAHAAIDDLASPRAVRLWRLWARLGIAPWRDVEEWNLPYYAACAYAVTLPDYPGLEDGEAGPFDDWRPKATAAPHPADTPDDPDDGLRKPNYDRWCRSYDRHSLRAVQQLDRAVIQRSRTAGSANAKGVADWILGEDPDLDLLRRHPRFRRWAAHHFQVTLMPDWHSRGFKEMRESRRAAAVVEAPAGAPRYVTFAERCCLGVLGSSVPWNREYVRWGLASGHHLTVGLQRAVPPAVTRLLSLARIMETSAQAQGQAPGPRPDGNELDLTVCAFGQELHRLWSCLPMYRLLSGQPEFRLELSEILQRLAGLEGHLVPGFPREYEALQVARFVDFGRIDRELRPLVQTSVPLAARLADATSPWTRLHAADGSGPGSVDERVDLLRQSAIHLSCLLETVEQSLGKATNHNSYRRATVALDIPALR